MITSERIEQDGLRLRTMMLEHVERDTAIVIEGYDLTVKESVWWQVLTFFGN
jgi:hypothetical protein